MRQALFAGVALALLFPSGPLGAQLLSERTEGLQRLCIYRGPQSLLGGPDGVRVRRVGLSENCPNNYPRDTGLPAPPTARLLRESITGSVRVCTYEQAGSTWYSTLPIARTCPLAAGLLQPERSDGERN